MWPQVRPVTFGLLGSHSCFWGWGPRNHGVGWSLMFLPGSRGAEHGSRGSSGFDRVRPRPVETMPDPAHSQAVAQWASGFTRKLTLVMCGVAFVLKFTQLSHLICVCFNTQGSPLPALACGSNGGRGRGGCIWCAVPASSFVALSFGTGDSL